VSSHWSCFTPEHFLSVPVDELRIWKVTVVNWCQELSAVEIQERFGKASQTARKIGNQHNPGMCDRERPEVKHLVVNHAQGQAVPNNCGSGSLVPFDVRCFKSNWNAGQKNLETTNGASVTIGVQDEPSKVRIAPTSGGAWVGQFKPDRVQNVLMERIGEMCRQDCTGEIRNERGLSGQRSTNVLAELPACVGVE